MHKRGSDDLQWQELKKIVTERDVQCKLIAILTAKEFLILQKNGGKYINRCDPAHVFGVGPFPKLCYDVDNVYLINHYSHSRLDNMCSPIDGSPMTKEEKRTWWIKIIGREKYISLLNKLRSDEDGRVEGNQDQ